MSLQVQRWFGSVDSEDLFTSVIVVGEIRRGIEKIRPEDPVFASQFELWLPRLKVDYQDRIEKERAWLYHGRV